MPATLLSLVPRPATSPHPRPYLTLYFGANARPTEWSHRGHAGSPRGALLAAMRQILDRRAVSAVIHGLDGEVIATLRRSGNSIRAVGSALLEVPDGAQ